MDPITILSVGAGIGQMVWGGIQNAKGKQRARRNVREDYTIPDETYQNLGMYEQLAQEGLPQNDLQFIHQNALRGLSQSLSTGLQLGASANSVNDYYQSYLNQLTEVGVRNAQQRFSNINGVAGAREALQKEKLIQFGFKDSQWKDEAQLASQEQTQGMGNLFGGLDAAIGGLVAGENRDLYQDQIDALQKGNSIQPQPVINQGRNVKVGTGPSGAYNPGPKHWVDLGGGVRQWVDGSDPGSFGAATGKFADPTKQSASTSYISNYLKQQGIGTNNSNNNDYYWRRLSEGNLNWWLTPGEHKN